jgi:hypothetical protein
MSEPALRPLAGARPSQSSYRLRDVYYFIPVAVMALGLGAWGFMAAPAASGCHAPGFGLAVWRAVLLMTRSGGGCAAGAALPLQLQAAQFLLPLLLALGTIFAGVKLAIRNLRHDARLAYVRTFHGHTVVCGLGATGLEAITQLARQPGKVVAICLDADEPGARSCERAGVPVIFGDATQQKVWAPAGMPKARAVLICTGSDARNMEICLAIEAARPQQTGLKLFPEIRGGWLLDTLGTGHAPALAAGLELHPFQANQIVARLLLRNPHFTARQPVARLLFIGFGDLAQAILRQAALSNYAFPGRSVRAAILDAAPLPALPPEIASWRALVLLTAVPFRFGAEEQADEAALRAEFSRDMPDIAIITLPDDDLSLQTAVLLRRALDQAGRCEIPIFVRVRQQGRLGELLGKISAIPDATNRLTGFGDLSGVVSAEALFDESLDILARAVHQTYLESDATPSPARVPWVALAERYRQSSRLAADHLEHKLNFAGYRSLPVNGPGDTLDDAAIESIAQAEHYRWCLTLRANGWRRDAARSELMRTHPLLVDWAELPAAVREDNRRQAAAIPQILSKTGRIVKAVATP